MKIYPYEKGRGGGGRNFSHAEGGRGEHAHTTLRGGGKSVHYLKGGQHILSSLEGGCKKFRTRDFSIL